MALGVSLAGAALAEDLNELGAELRWAVDTLRMAQGLAKVATRQRLLALNVRLFDVRHEVGTSNLQSARRHSVHLACHFCRYRILAPRGSSYIFNTRISYANFTCTNAYLAAQALQLWCSSHHMDLHGIWRDTRAARMRASCGTAFHTRYS